MITINDATPYTIHPGQSNFRPLENPAPRFSTAFKMAFRFAPSCWWSVDDWEGDRDRDDWNKLKGLTWFFSPNNKCSAMIAWRPGKLENVFEVTAYTNDKRGNFVTTGEPVQVHAGEVVYATGEIFKRYVDYTITYFGNTNPYRHDFNRPWFRVYREVGTSIGGADNSPGPYGGQATQYMEMEVAFDLI